MPDLLAEYDNRYQGPCCSAVNTTCCGHDEYHGDDAPAEIVAGGFSLLFPSTVDYRYNYGDKMDALTGLIIDSPNYCGGRLPF